MIHPLPRKIRQGEDDFVDDEVFLDEDEAEELKRMNATKYRKPNITYMKLNKGKHIVYKKKFPFIIKDSHSDYGKTQSLEIH